jgi:hypothetical protein
MFKFGFRFQSSYDEDNEFSILDEDAKKLTGNNLLNDQDKERAFELLNRFLKMEDFRLTDPMLDFFLTDGKWIII